MDFDRDMVSKSLAKGTATRGVDIELVKHISENVSILFITASGAGKVEHFSGISEKTDVEEPLTEGIFQTEGRSADWGRKGTYEGARNRASLNNDTISVHLKSPSQVIGKGLWVFHMSGGYTELVSEKTPYSSFER